MSKAQKISELERLTFDRDYLVPQMRISQFVPVMSCRSNEGERSSKDEEALDDTLLDHMQFGLEH